MGKGEPKPLGYLIFMNSISAFSAGAILFSIKNYDAGTLKSMGPGLFPICVGALMLFSSLLVSAREGVLFWKALSLPKGALAFPRQLAAITGAMAAFAIAAPRLGAFMAIALSVLTASLARERGLDRQAAILAAAAATAFCLLFIGLLGVQLKVLPA